MQGAVAALLPDGGRLHLQHGPIDLVVGVDGDRSAAFRAATARFDSVLAELVAELPVLRQPAGARLPAGAVARRMHAATRPHAEFAFVTPMAAVAGAVADEVLAAMLAAADLRRAYVNNGGDIALHLAPGTSYRLALARPGLPLQPDAGGPMPPAVLGHAEIGAADGIRGIATSGRGGRSLTLGIAEAVCVLADCAATADAAATLIANEVDLPGHPAIRRAPACTISPDSDLGTRLVVTGVGALDAAEIAAALDRGAATAAAMLRRGALVAASLVLGGQHRIVGRGIAGP